MPSNSAVMDGRAGDVKFYDLLTTPLNVPVSEKEKYKVNLAKNNGIFTVNSESLTHPLNAPVSKSDKKQTEQALQANFDSLKSEQKPESLTTPLNVPVSQTDTIIKQAGLGKLICEYCGTETDRKTHNQRFCNVNCRVADWELKHGTKIKKGKK